MCVSAFYEQYGKMAATIKQATKASLLLKGKKLARAQELFALRLPLGY